MSTRTNKPTIAEAASGNFNAYVKELEEKLAMYEAKENETTEEITISQTDYIRVMSLLPYRLNLSTRERGQGKIYHFDYLFQVKRIIYSDLVDILEVCRDFVKDGYFIILSPKVIRLHGLDEAYEKILTKEKIEQILSGSDEQLTLYLSANPKQQQVIVELFVDKMIQDPGSVNLNIVDKLSRLSGINIIQKAEDSRLLMNPTGTEEKK